MLRNPYKRMPENLEIESIKPKKAKSYWTTAPNRRGTKRTIPQGEYIKTDFIKPQAIENIYKEAQRVHEDEAENMSAKDLAKDYAKKWKKLTDKQKKIQKEMDKVSNKEVMTKADKKKIDKLAEEDDKIEEAVQFLFDSYSELTGEDLFDNEYESEDEKDMTDEGGARSGGARSGGARSGVIIPKVRAIPRSQYQWADGMTITPQLQSSEGWTEPVERVITRKTPFQDFNDYVKTSHQMSMQKAYMNKLEKKGLPVVNYNGAFKV